MFPVLAKASVPCHARRSDTLLPPQVSWVRRRDWHILTSGALTYTREGRFAVHHPEGSTEWTLAIKYVQLEDAGTYECQVGGGRAVLHQTHQMRNKCVQKTITKSVMN